MALATVADLADYGYTVTSSLTVAAERLLDSVSAQVEDAAGGPITSTTSTVVLAGTTEQFLPLPRGPVQSVAAVTLDGVAVTDAKPRDGRLWRPGGWIGQHVDVEVTYTHGLADVPADIVRLVCQMVTAGLLAVADDKPVPDRMLAYERVDDYQAGYRTGADEVVDVTELPERVRDRLRARFGCPMAVVRGV